MNDWKPNAGPQTRALQSTAFETLYGGARGGGKTDAGLVWMLKCITNPDFRGLVIRRNADDLSDWVDRASKLYLRYGATIAYKPAIIKFPSGAIIRSGHLKDEQAYTKYQGHEYHRMLIEELTQIPDEKRYLQLVASCRSTVSGLDARIFATTNPGGVGHGWVKRRFVDPAPPGQKFRDPGSGRTRVFIPAKVEDTPQLVKNDPGYIQFLEGLKTTDIELWKAWRLGDWDTFAGQYFKSFRREFHVIPNYHPDLSKGFLIGSLDWGRVDNFAFFVHHVFPTYHNGQKFFRIVTFIEVYGNDKYPDEWAKIIKGHLGAFDLKLTNIPSIMSDNQIFSSSATDMGKTIADLFYEYDGEYRGRLKPASKNRVAGWEGMQKWLSFAPDGMPYWQMTEGCLNLVRTLPYAIHDENKVEDIDQSGEDDALDSVRYGFSELKWIDASPTGVERGIIETGKTQLSEDLDIFGEY